MKRLSDTRFSPSRMLSLLFSAGLVLLPLPSLAASVALANAPLANAVVNAEVLPNLMIVFDDSGSMAWDYLPDWANGGTAEQQKTNAYNNLFYDPALTYSPPGFFNADGTANTTTYPSWVGTSASTGADTSTGHPIPNWEKVKRDGYGKMSTSVDNLSANITSRMTYVVEPGEYCSDPALKLCAQLSAPTTTYKYPAPLRWCKTAANASAATPPANSCQSVRVESGTTFNNARMPAPRMATLTVNAVAIGDSIDSISVNGKQILPATVTSTSTTASALAQQIVDGINACNGIATGNCQIEGFAATRSGSSVTITAGKGVVATPVISSTPASYYTTFSLANASNGDKVSSIKVSGKEILSGQANSTSGSESDLAGKIATSINNCKTSITGNCTVAGYSATTSGSSVIIFGNAASPAPVVTQTGLTITGLSAFAPLLGLSVTNFNNPNADAYPRGYSLLRVIVPGATPVYPYPGTYPGAAAVAKAPTRSDCAASNYCTGDEEMINFANWYAYYQTRNQAMKTAISLAFKDIDARYRIGLTAQSYTGYTDGAQFLHVDKFELAHKRTFLTTLFGLGASGGTPTRPALSKVGRIFAHKLDPNAADPMQYSCQKNYAFVATDGYWNGGTGLDVTGSANVGDMDGGSTQRPYYQGSTASSNSMADIAKYYYDTDLRTTALGNCIGGVRSDGSTGDVCANDFGSQRMTTFALALGIAGKLVFTSDYRTATSGDYFDLKNGLNSVNWPDPQVNSTATQIPERIDDLWHAAVNSDGIYFSAKSPTEVVKSLRDALGQIDKKVGSGAAAAASSLQPTAGDNFNYVASYTTVQWTGNLEARSINLNTGATAVDATWCVVSVVPDTCAAPSTIVTVTSGSSTTYYCHPPSGPDVEIATSCTGTLSSKVAASSDTRNIYMSSGTALQDFSYANLTAKGLNTNFDNTFLRNNLSQRSTLSTDQLNALDGPKLVAYLRGQYGYDMRPSNDINSQLFRLRAEVLGDIVESQPAYIAKPTFTYTDTGYSAFKTAQASRAGTVYVGANDGMLHAFDGASGVERWAFVPTPLIPNLWRLADDMYSTNHRNYVNGSTVISDIYDGTNWKTILVGGLNAGGRGYYALDITNPTTPSLLWEFTSANDSDLGFTYGNPIVTKKSDGTWVVLVTSGYNNGSGSGAYTPSPTTEIPNTPAGDGRGYLYVLNANTGAKLSKISTSTGTAVAPSGLGKISAWADNAVKNNTATYTYGGDLLGNLWRFDINAGSVMLFATLKDSAGNAQPITVRPELGKVNGKRMVFVGTGKYLEQSDLATTATQTAYGIMDADAAATLSDPRSQLVEQTVTNASGFRTVTSNPVDYASKRGWYIDFPDSGERQNVDGILESGLMITPTTVPTSTVCSPGGYSWLNYVDYKTGGKAYGAIANHGGVKLASPIVGMNIIYINKNSDGSGGKKPVLSVVTANDPTPKKPPEDLPFGGGGAPFSQKKVIWRELIQ